MAKISATAVCAHTAISKDLYAASMQQLEGMLKLSVAEQLSQKAL
jgi:hypothetical protein